MAEKKESAKSTREKAAEARAAAQAAERRRERMIRIIGGLAVLAVVVGIIAIGVVNSGSKSDTAAPDANSPLPTGVTADNQYGWLQIYGKGSARTLASAAKGTRLNSTSTDGALDDDGGTGAEAIDGLVLGTATGGEAATNADAMFSYPTVGATL